MKKEYISLIKQLDSVLGMLREQYLEADPEKKPIIMKKINSSLDERLRLMKERDKNE